MARVDDVVLEGVLMADALGRLARDHRRLVDAARAHGQLAAVLPEASPQGRVRKRRELPDPLHAKVAERLPGLGPDTPQAADRQRRQEVRLPARRYYNQRVRLAQVRGDLGYQAGGARSAVAGSDRDAIAKAFENCRFAAQRRCFDLEPQTGIVDRNVESRGMLPIACTAARVIPREHRHVTARDLRRVIRFQRDTDRLFPIQRAPHPEHRHLRTAAEEPRIACGDAVRARRSAATVETIDVTDGE